MRDKTVKQLRAIARKQGCRGYSRLRRDELLRMLARRRPEPSKPKPKSAAPGTRLRRRPAPKTGRPGKAAAVPRPGKRRTAAAARAAAGRKRNSRPKVAARRAGPKRRPKPGSLVMPVGLELPVPFVAADLGEDIESLPPLPDALLGLLPQKPGILHGYWALEPGTLRRQPDLRIRLCRIRDRVLEVLDEIPLPSDSGRWYFHVGDLAAETQLYAQLGHYGTDRKFVTAIDHGIARLPSLHASAQTDADWWISDAEFGQMYVRTGGRPDGQRLVWSASVSSR
ncbi:MAG: hypothetical protein M0Z84_07050 [Gammaproteobacteria bacterium]|nr:hypothetical protein [Gammaproteobacteria bacterium]